MDVCEPTTTTDATAATEEEASPVVTTEDPVSQIGQDWSRKGSRESQTGSETDAESILASRSRSSIEPPEEDRLSLPSDNEDHVLFQNVTYLGAAAVRSPRHELEILKNLATLNGENQTAVLVDLLVPRVPQGHVVLFEQGTEDEVAKYPVFRIIFCARGGKGLEPLSNCFAFTFGHGSNEEAVFLCHAFRCQSHEQVSKIIMCFSSAFRKPVSTQLPQGESVFIFDVCMEVKEDDSRSGSFTACPKESRDCFKLRVNLPKELAIHILQVNPENPHLSLEKCSGIWLAAGKNISRSDFHCLPGQTWDTNGKQFNVSCPWDPRDEKFLLLNTETPGDHRSHMTIVMDVMVAGFAEPITFVIHAKARIFAQTEKFWMPGRRQLQETFFLRLSWQAALGKDAQKGYYNVISLESQSQREGRCQNIAPLLEHSSSSDDDDSQSDEALPSGYGEVSRECSEEELKVWSDVLIRWRPNLTSRPKNLATLIRKSGIPQSMRCEVWQLLSGCAASESLLENYKLLSIQDSIWESAISKDITRTFPAHEYFKQTGSEGQDQLFRVIKAFANHDPETGYCQSLSFIAATFLLQMPEEQAFCLLCCVMERYGMRDMMKSDFDGLRLRFYQLERLLEEKLPDLFYHLRDIGVEVHMFASQWFLTLYTAKFPLFCVFRIIDLLLCDGHNVIFQVATGLLRLAKADLLQLDFEAVLKYFRVNLPKRYKNEDTVCLLLYQAVNEKVNVKKLDIYEKEFRLLQEQRNSTETPAERAKREARELMETIMRLERENDELAHELINGKIQLRNDLDNAEDQNELQQKEISRLNSALIEAEDEARRLRDEAVLVKELCRKIENENKQQVAVVAEYKRINTQLDSRLDALTTRFNSTQEKCCSECQNVLSAALAEDLTQSTALKNGQPPGADDERITNLELELARTKLALVEKECYTQDLLHQLSVLSISASANHGDQNKNNWLSKTIKSAAIKTQAALVGTSSSTNIGAAPASAATGGTSGRDSMMEKRPSRTDSATSQ